MRRSVFVFSILFAFSTRAGAEPSCCLLEDAGLEPLCSVVAEDSCLAAPGVPVPDELCCAALAEACTGAGCYSGPPATAGVGACQAGEWTCEDGGLVCSGEVTPAEETCNGIDDDCDGVVDEDACGCEGGAVAVGTAPGGGIVLCDDPANETCEQDMESLCPSGWNLCTRLQFNERNAAWGMSPSDVAGITGSSALVGEILCRGFGGAGHWTVGSNLDGASTASPLSLDRGGNCHYGSSRPSCPTSYGCNETIAVALCCAPTPSCGNGIVDSPEEECDDGNGDDTDACLSSCVWRRPTDHPGSTHIGSGC